MLLLKNNDLTVRIKPYGAELSGISDNKTEREYLWQGEPSVWSGQAPILFPITGRLLSDSFTYGDEKYYLQKHGFARKSAFEILADEETRAAFRLTSSEETRRVYPFEFSLTVEYRLEGRTLFVRHQVENTGENAMFFSIGAHPAFNVQLGDCVRFPKFENLNTLLFDDATIAVGEKTFAEHCDTIPITEHLFDDDALFFRYPESTSASLVNANGEAYLDVSFGNVPFLGLWAKPGAPFVCIEPWQGISDTPNVTGKIEEKPFINRLDAGEVHIFSYSIHILP